MIVQFTLDQLAGLAGSIGFIVWGAARFGVTQAFKIVYKEIGHVDDKAGEAKSAATRAHSRIDDLILKSGGK